MEDRSLIRDAQGGSISAFRRLVFAYDADMLALAMRITASEREARRLYHEAMLRIHQELPGFRFECAFSIWMCRHFSAASLDYLRRKQARPLDSMEGALDALTARERMAVELKHYRKESLETVGAILNMTGESAGNALARGIRKLRVTFDEHNPINS